jgi:hypothetical protein
LRHNYDHCVAEKAKIRLLFKMPQLSDWEAGAAWEDFKLGVKRSPTSSGWLWSAKRSGRNHGSALPAIYHC